MKLISDVVEHFKSLGIKTAFKPYIEDESEHILLRTRKPAKIVDGRLVGVEIAYWPDKGFFEIWTPRTTMCMDLARKHKLGIRVLTGECELQVPVALADELLFKLGAKRKRKMDEAKLAHLARMREKL